MICDQRSFEVDEVGAVLAHEAGPCALGDAMLMRWPWMLFMKISRDIRPGKNRPDTRAAA